MMKVAIVANVSANGRILSAENPNHQAPQEAMGIFMEVARQTGNLVVGKKTFDMFRHFPGGAAAAFPGVEVVVLSATDSATEDYKVVNSPEEAIEYLSAKGFKAMAVGGGTQTYNAFMDKDLVTNIYFNVLPIITGNGGILATNGELDAKFIRSEHKLLTDDIIQIHWVRSSKT